MTQLAPRAFGYLLSALLVLSLGACAREPERDAAQAAPPTAAGDYLADTESAHERADAALAAGHDDAAHAVLLAALEHAPPASLQAADARVVRQDLCFRLSQLALKQTQPQDALKFAQRGLELGRTDDLFTANLYVAQGQALQALSQPAEAASSYQAALQINERLLQATLAGDAGR